MATPPLVTLAIAARLEAAVDPQRFASCRPDCCGDVVDVAELHQWNAAPVREVPAHGSTTRTTS